MEKIIILLGAGRSGTNMLRDILCQLPGVGTWPCDEINYIWRHGNARYPTDELRPEQAGPSVKRYIRDAFEKLAKRHSLNYVIEKTCANTLRVPFISEIFPEAKFIHLIRDGRDVAVSAAERWTAPLDIPYLAQKAAYVPIGDLPLYAGQYFINRLRKLGFHEKRLSTWGPKFMGMEEILHKKPLPVACALQWQYCVKKAEYDLSEVDGSTYRLRYEDFVQSPEKELKRLIDSMDIPAEDIALSELVKNVSSGSVGRWKKSLAPNIATQIERETHPTLKRYGYV